MRLVPTLAALALLAAPAHADDRLLLYPALGRPSLVTVVGQAGRGGVVEVSLAGQVRRAAAAPDGRFEATFAAPADRPFPVGPQVARAAAGKAAATGEVLVVDDGAPFLVVLDLDGWPGLLRPARAPGEAEAPPAALGVLLRCLLTGTRPAAAAVVVTGRPAGEVAALRAALARDGFPPLAVRVQPGPGGLESALRELLSSFPQAAILLGEGSGRAPARFAALAAEFPGRVVATYLRASAPGAADRRFEGAILFTDPLELARRAAVRGAADAGCAARVGEAGGAPEPTGGAAPAGAAEAAPAEGRAAGQHEVEAPPVAAEPPQASPAPAR